MIFTFTACPGSGCVFSSVAGTGTYDTANKRMYSGNLESAGSDGSGRSQAHVHADARGGETKCHYYYF